MNGKVTSNVGQRVALWPVNPHEKHLKSDQLRRTCPNLGPCLGDCCPVKYVCSNVSNPGGSAGGAGSLFAVSDSNSWTSLSNGDQSGGLAGGGAVGVSTANNFFNSSSL